MTVIIIFHADIDDTSVMMVTAIKIMHFSETLFQLTFAGSEDPLAFL